MKRIFTGLFLLLLLSVGNVSAEENTTSEQKETPVIEEGNAIAKADLIWNKISKKTAGYSDDKKRKTYKKLLGQIQIAEGKIKKQHIKDILNILVIQLEKELQDLVGIFDRTEEFYKNTLQEKTYSCEISSTSDILSTIKNKNFTEDELIEVLDKSWFGKKAQYNNGIYIWGNPEAGFVGYIDMVSEGVTASQRRLTGYGVYEAPIAKIYNDHGIKTEIINNSQYTKEFGPDQHLERILTEFTAGNYVQLWGDFCTTETLDDGELDLAKVTQEDVDNGKNAKNTCWSYGQDRKRVWYYENGGELTKHQGLVGEHNFYLLGYTGEVSDPESIIVWDTATGKHIYTVAEWMRKWGEMDYRSIIIYNK